jgi:acyl carrier protein
MEIEMSTGASASEASFSAFASKLARIMEVEMERLVPGAFFSSLGLDSMMAAEICNLLEHDYDTVVPIETFARELTVAELFEVLQA